MVTSSPASTGEAAGGAGGRLVLAAAMVLAAVLGTVHAFSVFLVPMEQLFGATRGAVSAAYSIALVSLTVAVLLGHRLYGVVSAPAFSALLLTAAALGTAIAAVAPALPVVWLGYGLVFGGANGLGYGYALQASAQANRARSGLAMGLVTAAYALGAFVSPLAFDAALAVGGVFAGMLTLTGALLAAVPVTWILLNAARFKFQVEARESVSNARPATRQIAVLWLGYGTGVAAGLMAIGHATGIAAAAGLSGAYVLAAPMCIAVANMAGSLTGGRLIDAIEPRPVLALLPVLSGLILYAMVAISTGPLVLVALAALGFFYGAIIAAYPAAIAVTHGAVAGIRIYGRVFTAWGTAGLLAPLVAGALYDWSGDYRAALLIAGTLGLFSGAVIYSHRA